MTDLITSETFNHLVDLAALELDTTQAEYLRRELNNQLNSIKELTAIPLDANLSPTIHGVTCDPQTTPPLREDEWKPFENPQAIINQAPQVTENYIIVPDIPHKTLE
jgi:aspartyl-tRNA(Asn)/glutamyl-tRNA(Gln) amidotransferase subunit C